MSPKIFNDFEIIFFFIKFALVHTNTCVNLYPEWVDIVHGNSETAIYTIVLTVQFNIAIRIKINILYFLLMGIFSHCYFLIGFLRVNQNYNMFHKLLS